VGWGVVLARPSGVLRCKTAVTLGLLMKAGALCP
jgi:hypothetical protein